MRTQHHSNLCIAALLLTTSGLGAQEVQFQIEKGVLNVPANRNQTYVYGGTFSGDRADLTEIANRIVAASQSNPSEAVSELQSLLGEGSFSNWGSVPQAPDVGPYANYDWITSNPLNGSPGAPIYLLVLNSDINSITANTRVGIVTATGVVVPNPGSSLISVGFTTGTDHWNDAVLGAFADGGSTFNLQLIPEPSSYALLFSALIAAGAIAHRRR